MIGAAGLAVIIALAFTVRLAERPAAAPRPRPWDAALPTAPGAYTGLYPEGVPGSYDQVTAFARATGVRPRLVTYYSGWLEQFQTGFAATVAEHGGVPLVQIDPAGISLTAIASGGYDRYLDSYARAVLAYHRPVILSFGHEMNGTWYSWGYRHSSPAAFVAAWRHIVTLFRARGARNVTWLWTVNVIHARHKVASPGPWWPGRSYVTWVGIDGYYFNASATFPPLFGPTIAAVRELTSAPILIAETAAAPAAGQPAKIADLFAGVRLYRLLGFVWFDNAHIRDWRLRQPGALAAFGRVARAYRRPAS
jgi:mannan endo-1,4-beta-mannosidase